MNALLPPFDYATLPAIQDFEKVLEPRSFTDLPPDWILGLSDVVDSRGAIAQGRYKAVNTAGAALISAVMNAVDQADYPFVFGGDGAAVALPGSYRPLLERCLVETACWARDELGLELRVALVGVREIKASGHALGVARFAPSPAVSYAMFSGGGLSWAEREMKRGRFALPLPPEPLRPDLSGLSCRWEPAPSERGVMLSLIAKPAEGADPLAAARALDEVLQLVQDQGKAGHPFSAQAPRFRWPPRGLALEARAKRRRGQGMARPGLSVLLESALGWLLFKTGWKLGGFDPERYRRQVALNADYRKFDDGLKMTLDCTRETSRAIARRLAEAKRAGLLRYGLFEQDSALMTCIVPSVSADRHFHFLDGSAGGYAAAAERMD